MRKGETDRVTMSQADVNAVNGSEATPVDGSGETLPPIMPHLTHSTATLDQLYPRVEAPSEHQLEDMLDDRDDGVFQYGLRTAVKILEQSQAEGRKRRPEETTTTAPPTTTPTTSTTVAVFPLHERLPHQVQLRAPLRLPPQDERGET